ncbi:hypothetical protein VPHD164_0053 [Vibrio phage D164]
MQVLISLFYRRLVVQMDRRLVVQMDRWIDG